MKKRFSILIVSTVIIGLALSLFGMALVPQTASAERPQSSYRQTPKPISAANIKVVKKILLPLEIDETRGRPLSPPGQDKKEESEGAATGILGTEVTGNKYAIVIGICDYPGTDYDLCESDGDSLHTYKALTELYGYKAENIRLLKDMGGTTGSTLGSVDYDIPTRDNIYNAIMDIKEDPLMSSDDEVVFFFSGHGTSGVAKDGDNEYIDEAIVVWNTEDDIADNITYIWDGELRDWFSDFGTTRIVFIFDTCLAGGMNDLADAGRVVVMSTEEDKYAYVYSTGGSDIDGDGVEDGEGVFSRLFVNKGMLQGLADVYDHGQRTNLDVFGEDVVVEEAFDYAKRNIPGSLKRRQKPVISDDFGNDLLL